MAVNRERKVLESAESAMHPGSELWARVADRIYPALVRLLTGALMVVLCISTAATSRSRAPGFDRLAPQENAGRDRQDETTPCRKHATECGLRLLWGPVIVVITL